MSVTQEQVVTLLENVLFESATQAEANAASWQANTAATSVSSLAAAMAASGEEKIAATVVGYYISALGRAPTAAEIRYYVAIAEQGLTASQIAAGDVSNASWDQISQYFSHSPEFMTRGGLDATGGLDQTGLLLQAVPWLYESVLGRAPTTAEVSYYDNLVINGTSLGTLFRYFTASQEFHTDTDTEIAAALANFGADAANGQTTSLSTITIGAASPPPTASFGALTTGIDTIDDHAMTGAHTYTATLGTSATLNSGDSLTGNGLATLAITDTGTGGYVLLPSSLTLSGIQTLKLNTGEDAGVGVGSSNIFDVSGVAGLGAFELTATGTGGDYIEVGSGVTVTASSHSSFFLLDALGTGNSLTLTDSALSTLFLTTLSGNIGDVTIVTTAANTSLTLNVLDMTSLHFTDSGNHITDLVIGGGVNSSSISAISDTALTSLSINTGEFLTFGSSSAYVALSDSLTTLDTSLDTSDVYFSVGAATVTATFGSGNSFITGSAGGSIMLAGNADSTGDVTVNGFDALTIGVHSYSSVTLEGTGGSVDITDTSMTNLDVDGLTLTGSLTAGSSGLTIAGTNTASSIAAISDASLTNLTVSGGKVTFGSSATPINLGASVATIDLSGDTDTAGTNYFTVNSNNIAITTGTDTNVIDLNSKTGAVITPGLEAVYNSSSPAPNLTLDHVVSGTKIETPNADAYQVHTSQLSDLIFFVTSLVGSFSNPQVGYSDLGGSDLYIVEATSSTAGNDNLWIVKIVGGSGFFNTLQPMGSGASAELLF